MESDVDTESKQKGSLILKILDEAAIHVAMDSEVRRLSRAVGLNVV